MCFRCSFHPGPIRLSDSAPEKYSQGWSRNPQTNLNHAGNLPWFLAFKSCFAASLSLHISNQLARPLIPTHPFRRFSAYAVHFTCLWCWTCVIIDTLGWMLEILQGCRGNRSSSCRTRCYIGSRYSWTSFHADRNSPAYINV